MTREQAEKLISDVDFGRLWRTNALGAEIPIEDMADMVLHLCEQIDEAQKDTARLDFVIDNGLKVTPSFDGQEWRVAKGDYIWGFGVTPRAAINDAMEKTPSVSPQGNHKEDFHR